MALSRLEDIHRYIAGFSLTTMKTNDTGITIPAYFLDTLLPVVNVTPCRLILPYAPRQNVSTVSISTLGGGQDAIIQVCDMFFYAPVGQDGRGVKDTVIPLMRYQTAYMQKLEKAYKFSGSDINATITDCRMEIATLNYPASSGDWFHAVEVILTIHEIIG